MNHVRSKMLAEAMYSALSMMHESKAHQTVNHIQCLLYETKVIAGADILKLAFEGPVKSGFCPLWAQTGTATGSMPFQNYIKPDRTT